MLITTCFSILLETKKGTFIFLKFLLLYFYCISILYCNNAQNKLKEIESKLERNKTIEKILEKKQNKIDSDIKNIEKILKNNKKVIKIQQFKKQKEATKLIENTKILDELKEDLSLLNGIQKKIILVSLKDIFIKEQTIKPFFNTPDFYIIHFYKNIINALHFHENELNEVADLLKISEKNLEDIEIELANINNSFLEKSNLETGLQGENIINNILRREKELESKAISQEARELKKLIESLKEKPRKVSRKRKARKYSLKRLEDILPVNLKNIQKMRTDRAKKGLVLTLKNKSFLTTPNDGIVVYADSFKGYGNMIILDLGNNYHIIYSGLTNIMCSVGDWVNAGKILGEIELEFKNIEVYLEVRFKGKTINPANWIKS